MADEKTKQRKRNRKSLAEESNELIEENHESLENSPEEIVCEPVTKCARKSNSPEPNLKSETENASKLSEINNVNNIVSREMDKDNTAEADEIDTLEDGQITESPIITITFANEEVLDTYKSKFMEFINKFAVLNATDVDNVIKVMLKDDTSNTSKKSRKKKKSKAKKELFVLDTNPGSSSDHLRPQYSSKFKVIEEIIEEVKDDESKCPTAKVNMCFNCDGNHNLSQCKERIDKRKITLARQKFKTSKGPQSVRYHIEEGQKYDNLAPGKLTDNLRKALGLKKNQVPEFIYRMRSLGYPPGWLEDAEETHSTLEIFGTNDKNMKTMLNKPHVNPDKIINYPGFNVKLEKNCKDDFKYYGCPPYSEAFSKEAMLKFINSQQAKNSDNLEPLDMDVDKEDKEEPPPGCESESDEIKPAKRISPSLDELESKKGELLAALDDGNSSTNPSINKESVDSTTVEIIEDGAEISTPSSKRIVKASCFGTPILKSLSPFARLPNADNFMKDVSPVINFENLPNSTGKYEQMTGVLERVRKTLRKELDKT